jgi:3-oxoacyl-[acyl-carrier protein] reductase
MTEIGHISYDEIEVDKSATYHSLKDRVVIITGGGQGIGRGYAHYFAAQGAIPVIAELNGEAGEQVAEEVRAKQGRALAVQTDVADLDSATNMAERTLAEFGRIDCLINNAAVFSRITMAPFWELPVDEWKSAVDVNVTGSFFCARAVVPAMQEAKWGRIVNVSSIGGFLGAPGQANYSASKSGLWGFTRSLAREVAPRNVTANCVAPGYFGGPMTDTIPNEMVETILSIIPQRRYGEPHELAAAVAFLASEESSYITGQILIVDGGIMMY